MTEKHKVIEKLQISKGVSISVYNDCISINIDGMSKLAFVDYSEDMLEIIKSARFRVPRTPETRTKYKYPYSNEYGKTLHQIVFDFYFSEEKRTELYAQKYIIEHLDNDGFNCRISNLYFLKDIKNTYKGWHLDKISKESMPVVAMKIYHIFENKTFQIVLFFNQSFVNKRTLNYLQTVKLLYEYNYEIVLQDAEQILESIVNTGEIRFDQWRKLYRYNDIRMTYFPKIELTEEEKQQGFGTLIWRDGKALLLVGMDENSIGLVNSVPYEVDWDVKQ
jgi:hypothetical protein